MGEWHRMDSEIIKRYEFWVNLVEIIRKFNIIDPPRLDP